MDSVVNFTRRSMTITKGGKTAASSTSANKPAHSKAFAANNTARLTTRPERRTRRRLRSLPDGSTPRYKLQAHVREPKQRGWHYDEVSPAPRRGRQFFALHTTQHLAENLVFRRWDEQDGGLPFELCPLLTDA